jgi:hypothetical protein
MQKVEITVQGKVVVEVPIEDIAQYLLDNTSARVRNYITTLHRNLHVYGTSNLDLIISEFQKLKDLSKACDSILTENCSYRAKIIDY